MSHAVELQLRDYQEQGIQGLREGFAAGHRAQILYAPTGGGKTELAISMMDKARRAGRRAAMVMDRVVLCHQTSERMDRYNIPHGVLQSGHWRYRTYEPIQVCSAQTLEKRGSFPGLDLLIVDEAHNTRAATAAFIAGQKYLKVVGLTATPFTKGLGKIYGNVVQTATTAQLIEQGNLAPLRVFIAKEIDMDGAKKVAGEWSDAEASERGMKITGDVVAEWVAKTTELFCGPRKTVVFSAGVAHGADLAKKFAEAGFNFVALSYKDDDQFKRDAIAEFAKPDSSIHGLIATDILTKGFDCPDVMIGISARPFSKSLSSHVQQLGRVMRAAPGKPFGVWLDHSGNYLRFQADWDEVFANGPGKLDDGREVPKAERPKHEKEAAKCPRCGHLWGNTDMCSHCGHVRVRLNLVTAVPGEMEEVTVRLAAERAKQRTFLAELAGLAAERGYKPGWAAMQFKSKYGAWPKGMESVQPSPPSAAVRKWVRSQQIRWAKSAARSSSSSLAA